MKFFINRKFKELTQFIHSLPDTFANQGEVIRNIRNEIRLIKTGDYSLVVKSYKTPNLFNRIIYGTFRKSKAERAYKYAELFLSKGIGSPTPVAYITERRNTLFTRSFYISLLSECPYTYYDLFEKEFDHKNDILKAIAETTAQMHKNGFLHNDYTGGNILFDDKNGEVSVEIIDLNRMSFKKIDESLGCKNFGKLRATEQMLEIMAEAYAKARGYEKNKCINLMKEYNKSWKNE